MVHTRILILSLDKDVARREQIAADAAGTGLQWQFFSGYRQPAAPLNYDSQTAILRSGRPLSAGEIGCFTSHYKAWEDFLASGDDQAIIMEDDVMVDWRVLEKMAAWDFAANGIDLMHLYSTHPFKFQTMVHRFISPHSHLVRVRGVHHGTQGYLITRRGAQALLDAATTTIYAPVDWIIARYWIFGLPAYCLFPFPLLERFGSSSIGEQREEAFRLSPLQRARYLARKIAYRARRAIVDARLAGKNPFAATGDVGLSYVDRTATAA